MTRLIHIPWDNRLESIKERHVDAPREVLEWPHKAVGFTGKWLIQGLFKTCLTQIDGYDSIVQRQLHDEASILAFWHCNILLMTGNFLGYDARVLISEHSDGEYISQVCLRLGMGVVRGSTTRGGARALIKLKQQIENGHDAVITPDGPKGPLKQVQSGAIYLAAKTGAPIVPIGMWSDSMETLGSWDGFRIPWPGSCIYISCGKPLFVPKTALKDLPHWQEKVRALIEQEEDKCREKFSTIDFKNQRGSWTVVNRKTMYE